MGPDAETRRIARALEGERAAFDALYDELLPVAWRLATARCRERAAAEALARAVLAQAFRHLGDRPPDRPLAGWLADLAGQVAARRRTPARDAASAPVGA